ncbi:Tetratricopeptide repeat (TPR)-like superfamily protein [Euphorbia peplus]|nr:Tetratricopeptide repeat (TPR)-like superfamily protein [Euphorbia peplus]
MDSIILKSAFFPPLPPHPNPKPPKPKPSKLSINSSIHSDPWSLSDGNVNKPKPKSKHPKKQLSDDNARRIIKSKAQYLSLLRKHQGPRAQTPKWIKRTPEQMVQYLEDDRNGQIHGKIVVAAVKTMRGMSRVRDEERDVRLAMSGFVGKLTFREMCVVLKEQKSWREARDFFGWMKLQLIYRPSVIVYTILLRIYGQVGKIKLAEQTFLEMLEAGCEPDEVACGTMLCSYARWGRHKAMLSFYSAIQDREILLPVSVYNFMLSSLQKKSLHTRVIDLWRQMVAKEVAPNNFTYTVVISSFVKEGLHDEAFTIFYEMKDRRLVPEELTYSLLITVSTKNCDWDQAERLYEDMRSCGRVPSNFTCASLLTMYYKNGDYPKALSLFMEMQSKKIAADEVIFGLLIRIYGKLGLYEDAQKTFKEIEQLGLLSDEKTYLAMAQVHLNSRNVEKALTVIEAMKSRNIWLSRYAYIVLLQCYVAKEDLDSAEATFQSLSRTGLPDAGSCNDLLKLYLKLQLTEKAAAFIIQIRKDQVRFDEELYKTVIKVFCKEGMLREIEKLIEDIGRNQSLRDTRFFQTFSKVMHRQNQESENIVAFDQPDTTALGHVFTLYTRHDNLSKIQQILKLLLGSAGGLAILNQLVSNFIREGDVCKAEAVTVQATKLGYKLEDGIIASLISLYGKRQNLKQAREFFEAVADSNVPGKSVINAMIDVYAKCGRSEDAYLLYKEVTGRGHNLNAVGISIIVKALTNSGNYQDAENIIRKTLQDSVELDTVAYNIFIKSMLEAGRLHFAASIFEYMLSVGVTPSIQTYNTMISVYGRGKKLDKAVEMFKTARNSDVPLDEKAYMNMISYYGKAGKTHEVSLLFTKMQEEGIKPGKVSYNIMIKVYATAGLHHEVEELFHAMERDGWPPDSSGYLFLVRAYTESLKNLEAEETIDVMQKKGIPPSCAHFNLLLSAYAKAGIMIEAERIYKKMSIAGLSPDLASYQSMLRGYMDSGLVEEGMNFFEQIRESAGYHRFIMSAAVHLYKFAGKKSRADDLLESMENMRIPFLSNLEVGARAEG